MATSTKIIDISKTGPQGFRELQSLNSIEGVSQEALDNANDIENAYHPVSSVDPLEEFTQYHQSSIGNFGESMRGPNMVTLEGAQQLDDIRANNQWGIAQIGAGIAKGGILALTTFADSVIGTFAGIINMITDDSEPAPNQSQFSSYLNKFIDNDFSRFAQNINEWAEKALPNYYTHYQQEHPWKTFLSANTIGDKFVKNLGFLIGAAYSGKVNAGILSKALGMKTARNAFKGIVVNRLGKNLKTGEEIYRAYRAGDAFMDGTKLTEDLAKSAKQLKNAEMSLKIFGGITSAMGEGRIEAISNSNDFVEYKMRLLDDAKNREMLQAYTSAVSEDDYLQKQQLINDKYNSLAENIAAQGAVMENQIFLLNTALLTFNNVFEFGRFFAGGYSRGRGGLSLIKTPEGFASNKSAIRNKYIRGFAVPFAEGNEEMAQALISTTTGLHAGAKINEFYGASLDPEATSEFTNWYNALSEGFHQTYGNVDTWEEGAIGFLTGLLGVPSFHMVKNEAGKNKISMSLESELWDNVREAKQMTAEQSEWAAKLNSVIQSDRYKNLFRTVIRDRVIQKEKNAALENGDVYSFKNAELKELVNWAIMFNKADMGQEILDDIDTFMNITAEDIPTIKENTESKETGKSIFEGMSDEDIIKSFKHEGEQIKSQVKQFLKVSEDLKTLYGDNLQEELLEELTYSLVQINDWEKRFKDLFENVRNSFIQQVIDKNKRLFGKSTSAQSSLYEEFKNMSAEEVLMTINEIEFLNILNANKEYIKNHNLSSADIVSYEQNLNDLKRMFLDRRALIDKYYALSKNPEVFSKENVALAKKIIEEKKKKSLDRIVDAVKDFKNVKELKDYFINRNVDGENLRVEGDNLIPILDHIIENGNDTTKQLAKKLKSAVMTSKKLNDIVKNLPNDVANQGAKVTIDIIVNNDNAEDEKSIINEIKTFAETAQKNGAKELAEALNSILEQYQNNSTSSKATTKTKSEKKKETGSSSWGMDDLLGKTSKDSVDETKDDKNPAQKGKEQKDEEDDYEYDESSYENIEEAINDLENFDDETLSKFAKGSKENFSLFDNLSDEEFKTIKKLSEELLAERKTEDTVGNIKGISDNKTTTDTAESDNPENYIQVLTNWVVTRYNIDDLKERHKLKRNTFEKDTQQFIDLMTGYGAFSIVESGALAELLKTNNSNDKTLPIHYIKPKDEQYLNNILLGIQIPKEQKELDTFKKIMKKYKVNYSPILGSDNHEYCIVGALGSTKEGNASKQVIINHIEEESKDNDADFFVSSLTNEIKKLYSGRMILQGEGIDDTKINRPLPKNLRTNRATIGVFKDGALHHNLSQNVIPLNKYNKNAREGSVWILTQEADGQFYAKAANVARFTDNEWNLESNSDTKMYEYLMDLAKVIVDPNKSIYDRAVSKYALKKYLYIPDEVEILFNGDSVSIHAEDFEANNVVDASDTEERGLQFLRALQSPELNLRFQISANTISRDEKEESDSYIDFLLDSNILTSDLFTDSEYGVHNAEASFDLYDVNSEGNPIIDNEENIPVTGHTGKRGVNNIKASKTYHINNKKVSMFNDGSITVDDKSLDEKMVPDVTQFFNFVDEIASGKLNPEVGTENIYIFDDTVKSFIIEKIRGGYKLYFEDLNSEEYNKKLEQIDRLRAEYEANNNDELLKGMTEASVDELEKTAETLNLRIVEAKDDTKVIQSSTPSEIDVQEASRPKRTESKESSGFLKVPEDEEDETIQDLDYESVKPKEEQRETGTVTWQEQLAESEESKLGRQSYYEGEDGKRLLESQGYDVNTFIVKCMQAGIPLTSISDEATLSTAIKQIKECE